MADPAMTIKRDTLRSPLTAGCIVLYGLAFLFGIPGVVLLGSPSYASLLLADLVASGIGEASSLRTWQTIYSVLTLLACAGPCIMALGLLIARRGRAVKGIGLMGNFAHGLYWSVTVSGAAACVVFVFRFLRYIAYNVGKPNGLMLVYSMVVSEALMAAQAAFLFVLIRKFLSCCIDSSASIAYTMATEKLDDRSIPGFAATGFLLLAIVGTVLAITRLFTLTIVWDSVQSYYKLLFSGHPAQIADGICLILGAGANLLMFLYLRRYKRLTEEALYQAKKLWK